jgi:hypothetical protein
MAIAYTTQPSTHFDMPNKMETGMSDQQVVCNGIASTALAVNVE